MFDNEEVPGEQELTREGLWKQDVLELDNGCCGSYYIATCDVLAGNERNGQTKPAKGPVTSPA